MSDIQKIGQTLLVGELYNGLAAKDAENTALRKSQIWNEVGNASADQKISDLEKENQRLRQQLQTSQTVNTQAHKALAEKDALMLEWMHSNEAFKQLARNYGKKLGVSDEQRQKDFDNELLNAAEENPQFKDTKKSAGAKQRLGQALKP